MDFVSPDGLRLPETYKKLFSEKGVACAEHADLSGIVSSADVIYMTRIQKERFASEEDYRKVEHAYVMDREMLKKCKPDAIILHPLPRITEIAPEIDSDPRAAYFRQAKNGLYVRMALLKMLLG